MHKANPSSTPLPAESTAGPKVGIRTLTPSGSSAARLEDFRHYAFGLGLARVGVAAVDRQSLTREAAAKTHHAAWVRAGRHGSLDYMAEARRSPDELLPGAASVVVGLANTEPVSRSAEGAGEVAAYARGQDYHVVLKAKLWQLAQHLCDAAARPVSARVCVDTAPILERFWAEEAGVTFTGKSTMAIAPGVGTTGLLGLLILDLPLSPTPRLLGGCGTCTLCLDACPTEAFPAPFVLEASRCISYLTIENSGEIPEQHRSAVGARLFGCDECQAVCPYNASRKRPSPLEEFRSRLGKAAPSPGEPDSVSEGRQAPARPEDETQGPRLAKTASQWLNMSSGDYRRLTKGSALRRAPRAQLQRNAAVVLGNCSRGPADEAALVTALRSNPSTLVRKHAAWALLRVNPTLAHDVLHELCETPLDPELRAEWSSWVEELGRAGRRSR